MYNEKINQATFNTVDEIRTLCTEISVDNAFETIPEKLTEKIKAFNRSKVLTKASLMVQDESTAFYRGVICVTTDQPYFAITADTVALSLTESGNIEVKETTTALTFNDFMEAKVAYYASTHTDKAPKEDREKAIRYFFGKNGVGLLQCLAFSATSAEKLDGVDLKKSADMLTAYASLKATFAEMGKDNPFDGTSNRKKVAQLETIADQLLGGMGDGWQYTKHHFDGIAKMIATVNRKGVFTIDNINGIMQSFIVVSRHAYNNLHLEIKDKAGILEKAKKN